MVESAAKVVSYMQEFVNSTYTPASGYTKMEYDVAKNVTLHWLKLMGKQPRTNKMRI